MTPIFPPFGLAYIAAVLRDNKIPVRILEANANDLSYSQITEEIRKEIPDFIGITTTTCLFNEAKKLAGLVKQVNSKIKVIVGGIHPTSLPNETLKECNDIDVVCRGEGEFTMLELAQGKKLERIKGISYRKGKKIIHNKARELIQNLDILPFPARDMLPMNAYYSAGAKKLPSDYILSSRGCPYSCIFCLHPDTEIMTSEGLIAISKITKKYKVLTHTGFFQDIKKIFIRQYNEDMLEIITPYLNKKIRITPDHKVYVFKKNIIPKICKHIGGHECRGYSNYCDKCKTKAYLTYKPKLIKALYIKRGDYLAIPIPKERLDIKELIIFDILKNVKKQHKISKHHYREIVEKIKKFSKQGLSTRQIAQRLGISKSSVHTYTKKDYRACYNIKLIENNGKIGFSHSKPIPSKIRVDNDFCRLVGYYLAEGHTTFSKNRPNSGYLGFTFNRKEKDLIQDVINLMKKIFKVKPSLINNLKNNTVQIVFSSNIIASLFTKLFGKGSQYKKIPNSFLFLPTNKQKELFKGYFMGDGNLNNYNLRFTSISKQLIDQFFFILLRCGILPSYYIRQTKKIKKSEYYGRTITAKHISHEIVLRGKNIDLYQLLGLKSPYLNIKSYKSAIINKNYIFIPIKNIKKRKYIGNVYNLSVANDKSYTANYFAISNCADHLVHGKKFRARSAENVVAEIELLIKQYGIKEFDFIDDNFTLLKERVEKICNLMISKGLNKKVIWRCSNGIRIDRVDFELLKLMKKAGCYMLSLGIESGNEQILKNIKKGINLEQVRRTAEWCNKLGIETRGLFMLGNLGENEQTMRDTIEFANSLDLDTATFHITVPFPMTEYWEIIEKEGKIIKKSWTDFISYGKVTFLHGSLTPEVLVAMQKKAYHEFYIRFEYILRRIRKIRGLRDIKMMIKGALGLLSSNY